MKKIIFALIPLILSIGIIPAIPFSDAAESNQICIDKVWIENNKGKIACVTSLIQSGQFGTVLFGVDWMGHGCQKEPHPSFQVVVA